MSSEFTAAEEERKGEPLRFPLAGRTWTCRRKLPFGLLGNLAARLEGEGPDALQAFADLLVFAVCKDEREDFRALLLAVPEEDDEEAVTFEEVAAVAALVIERVTGSPFASVSGSPPSRSANGAMSPAASGSGGSTSAPHRRVKL